MRAILLFLTFYIPFHLVGQILPESRTANWDQAGCRDNYPQDLVELDILDFGATTDGSFDNSTALINAITALNGLPGVISFPEGQFLFEHPIYLSSNIILRGTSSINSILTFNLTEEAHLINIIGTANEANFELQLDAEKEIQQIQIDSDNTLEEGDFIYIIDNDIEHINDYWAEESTGQIVRINEKSEGLLQLNSPLRRSYKTALQAKVVKIKPVEKVGIENLYLERLDATLNQTSNIHLEYASDCWVKCVESNNCNFAHVNIQMSIGVEVSGSYFHHAFDYGIGGKAYGVMVQRGSGECLVENNIFNNLRHAMILQAGANGNVFAYNYSVNPFWTGVSMPTEAAGDIVLHGNYPYGNLLEGNIVQNIVVDNSHGINGPHNTFFRNRAELYGIFMNDNPASNEQNFIGNEITNGGFLLGLYEISGNDHFEYGNNDFGSILPNNTSILTESSLFSSEIPAYLDQAAWPPVGIPNAINSHMNSAKERFSQIQMTHCSSATVVSSTETISSVSNLKTFPNPVKDYLQLEVDGLQSIEEVLLYNLNGQLVLKVKRPNQIALQGLESGLYTLIAILSDNQIITKKIIKSKI